MLQGILITNKTGSILLERFRGFTAEECSHWRSFLARMGQKDLLTAANEEQFVATYGPTYAVYTGVNDLCFYLLGSDECDELGLSLILTKIIELLREVCKRSPSQAAVLDRYGKICLGLDEVMAQGILEHMDKDRIRRLMKMKPMESTS